MNEQTSISIESSSYDRNACQIGVVHLGFGAFHRAHQAVYLDDYMDKSGDLNWGIAAINLRSEHSKEFARYVDQSKSGYLLKTTSPNGVGTLREIRSHVRFADWALNPDAAEELLCLPSVKVVSMTVTESGYYLSKDWSLDESDPVISAERSGGVKRSVYAYLASALMRRMITINEPITILCCDNIRSNGEKLAQNFKSYLRLLNVGKLLGWVEDNCTFPNSMVDRITPRTTGLLRQEISSISPKHSETAIQGEAYIEWVLEDNVAGGFPALERVGVKLVSDVDPYEEAKIRILNGGHTALCYLGVIAGYRTFDQVMSDSRLRKHFDLFQADNVLQGLTLNLPFDKNQYCNLVASRFSNKAIADELARICMDGWSKFPIFIRPTMKSCLEQAIEPTRTYESIASWYVFARRISMGKSHVNYVEPYWDDLKPMLAAGREADFAACEALWSDLPVRFDGFIPGICNAINRIEEQWPV